MTDRDLPSQQTSRLTLLVSVLRSNKGCMTATYVLFSLGVISVGLITALRLRGEKHIHPRLSSALTYTPNYKSPH